MLKRVTYQFDGERRTRCFEVLDGELAPVDCPPAPTSSIGIGDLVADGTRAFGVTPCGSCKRRQAALNRATPKLVGRLLDAVRRYWSRT